MTKQLIFNPEMLSYTRQIADMPVDHFGARFIQVHVSECGTHLRFLQYCGIPHGDATSQREKVRMGTVTYHVLADVLFAIEENGKSYFSTALQNNNFYDKLKAIEPATSEIQSILERYSDLSLARATWLKTLFAGEEDGQKLTRMRRQELASLISMARKEMRQISERVPSM